MNIVGISMGYHDSACCLIQNGLVTAAAQEERFSRIKNDPNFPRMSLAYCLNEAGLSIADIDCVSYYEDPVSKHARQIWSAVSGGATCYETGHILGFRVDPLAEIRRVAGYEGQIMQFEHHQSHAASSYYYSGFDDAAILTVDGVGEWKTISYSQGREDDIIEVGAQYFPDSLGLFYSTITAYLGFDVNEGEYKVMGLAPYGKPTFVNELRSLLHLDIEQNVRLDMTFFDFISGKRMYSDRLPELFGFQERKPGDEITQVHKDLACSVQVMLEEAMLGQLERLHKAIPSSNLCLAGGVALNVVANARALREGPFAKLFVQPAAGDAGCCLGAAALAHRALTGKRPCLRRITNVFWGPGIKLPKLGEYVRSSGAEFIDFTDRPLALIEMAVDKLIEGKIIGWVQGRMEFGPRSLGARSILADPRRPEMREKINRSVKFRESFRPFAPVVLAHRREDHFDIGHESPFMLETCSVRSPLNLPSVTHVDGSARVQTLDHQDHPRLHALLSRFEEKTGCPILLNTSFNLKGEPIVCDIYDALVCFTASRMDYLFIEDFVISRKEIPELWRIEAAKLTIQLQSAASKLSHIYTFM